MTIASFLRTAILATVLLYAAPATLRTASAAPQAAPAVTNAALHVESPASAIKPTNPSLSQVRVGQPFRLILYVGLAGLKSPVTTSVSLDIFQGKTRDFG